MVKQSVLQPKNLIIGLLLFVATLSFLFLVIPMYCIDPPGTGGMIKPSGFVRIITKALLAGSLLLAVTGFFPVSAHKEQDEVEKQEDMTCREWLRVFYTALIIVPYIATISYLGFYLSSAVFMVVLMYFFGTRNKIMMTANISIVLLFIYLIFKLALKMILPEAAFFSG